MKQKVNVMWFRRDIRLHDNAALYHALKSENPVVPVFIFDQNILDDLEEKKDRRVEFIYQEINAMQQALVKLKSSFEVYYGAPEQVYKELLEKYTIQTVFANEDYEQYALDRDEAIHKLLKNHDGELKLYKDQVIFSKNEVMKDDGTPYTVFTPFSKRWKEKLNSFYLKSYPAEKYFKNFYPQSKQEMPSLKSMGFEAVGKEFPDRKISNAALKNYGKLRNFPGEDATSHLSIHLRFGTISIRDLARQAQKYSDVFFNELIWRDFYQMILWHFKEVRTEKAFLPQMDNIQWRYDEKDFKAWCEGKTGYPIVDAGMRQLNEIGYMHNRIRMVTASFLSKHLLIDWRWGEAYFAKQLLDFDYAANNGGWQWASSTGTDAMPYFRIFNPETQQKKFDKDFKYIKKWVPEFGTGEYPQPIIEHTEARKRALEAYTKAAKSKK